MIVLIKQVPDTHNVTGDAMKPDGTVNRSALPAIFNPEDLNALEEALKIKETVGGSIAVITMGPPKAAEILKDCLYRGADDVILVTDRRFAAADTLATSYALKCAIERVGEFDLLLCGRQAIDGDTAQVGPQTAEKLGINQFTCVNEILEVKNNSLIARRSIDGGYEIVHSKLPLLLTITSETNEPRSPSVKLVMAYKKAVVQAEEVISESLSQQSDNGRLKHIREWNVETIKADPDQCGLSGSPTKVKKVQNVVLTAKDIKFVPDTENEISNLMHELIDEHIIG